MGTVVAATFLTRPNNRKEFVRREKKKNKNQKLRARARVIVASILSVFWSRPLFN